MALFNFKTKLKEHITPYLSVIKDWIVSNYMTTADINSALDNKSNKNHKHDNRYYKKNIVDTQIANAKKLSNLDIDSDKDWNSKSISNLGSLNGGTDTIGYALVNNELHLIDKSGNVFNINKYDSEYKTEMFCSDKDGNIITDKITLYDKKVTMKDKNFLLVKDGILYDTTAHSLSRSDLALFDDSYLLVSNTTNMDYIGTVAAWGESVKLPYRFAVPIRGKDVFNTKAEILQAKGIIYELVDVDSAVDDGNGGKKKYTTIRFRPPSDGDYFINMHAEFLLRNLDDTDWVGCGIDDSDNPNGASSPAIAIGAINLDYTKFSQNSNLTFSLRGKKSVTLKANKWYYPSIYSISRAYMGVFTLEVTKNLG